MRIATLKHGILALALLGAGAIGGPQPAAHAATARQPAAGPTVTPAGSTANQP